MRGSQYGFGNGTGMVPVRTSQWRCPEPQTIFGKTLLGQASKTSLAAMSRACVCKPSVIKCRRTIGAANGKKGRRTDQVTQKKSKTWLTLRHVFELGEFCSAFTKFLWHVRSPTASYTDRKERQITVCSVSTKPVLPEGMKP